MTAFRSFDTPRSPGGLPSRHAMFPLLLMASALGCFVTRQALALPLYASREGKTCVTCHYDPNGGGMRNDFGFLYVKNRHGMDTEQKWAKVTIDPRLNEWVAVGMDTRVLYIASHTQGGRTLQASTFFPMQGQLNLALTPHDYLTVVMSHGIRTDKVGGEDYDVRELYGLIHGLPHDLYAQIGRFRLPFGLRQDDHTSYIRTTAFLPYNSQQDDVGLEVGAAGASCTGQLSFTNGQGTILSGGERAQTLAAKATVVRPKISGGVSGFHQFNESLGIKQDRWSAFALSTWQRLTLLGEYGSGTQRAFGVTTNLWAAFAEADYRLARGVNLRGKVDYLDPDKSASNDQSFRWLVETDLVAVPFTELKLSYRNHDEKPTAKYQEYLVQFFFPF